eukprot:PhM_4_TR11219/c0_g2_i1/m.78207/K11842/USP12_46; ubiquitin carboxyl-terminal hydrolase 12/46
MGNKSSSTKSAQSDFGSDYPTPRSTSPQNKSSNNNNNGQQNNNNNNNAFINGTPNGHSQHPQTAASMASSTNGKSATDCAIITPSPPPSSDHVVGLENFGNTCYLNSVVQVLYHCRPVRDAIMVCRRKYKDDSHTLLTRLAQLFQSMDGARRRTYIAPTNFVQMVRRVRPEYQSSQHQDAPEFLLNILNDIIELERGPVEAGQKPPRTFVEQLFEGTQRGATTCLGCDTTSTRNETFLSLSVEVFPNSSLTYCMRQSALSESLRGANKLYCDCCGGSTEGRLQLLLDDMPKVLVIQLKRFRYVDMYTGHRKLSHRVSFPTTTLLLNDRTYRLRGVVIHQGSATNVGHYLACVRTASGQWWLCDDDRVTPIEDFDIQAYFGHTASAAPGQSHHSSSSYNISGSSLPPISSTTTAYLLLYEAVS